MKLAGISSQLLKILRRRGFVLDSGRPIGTQIDVLKAQTALTEAHGSFVDALHNYSVVRASLLRATGVDLQWSSRRR
jgi:hypothetical protein